MNIKKMDCYEILTLLTQFNEDTNNVIIDEKLKKLLDTVNSKLSEDFLNELIQDRSQINEADDTGWKYLHLLLYTIRTVCKTELAQENPLFTVNQFKIIKTAIEIVASVGIIPFLLLQMKTYGIIIRTKIFKLSVDDSSIFEKYKRISYTTKTLLECYNQVMLRPALLSQLGCILAALLQLSHAPLKKPTEQSSKPSANACRTEFKMTTELYVQLKEEQNHFCKMLHDLIENSPQSLLIREFMKLLGLKNNPKWLQINIKCYLTKRIMLQNGIVSLTLAICDDVCDIGKCWDKLDIAARLVATSHGSDAETYYDSISFQILELFTSKNNKQGNIIANCCIKALYDYNQDVCLKKVIHVIMKPFLIKYDVSNKHLNITKTEEEVSQCIENLCKLFLTTDAEFKCLPTGLLTSIVLPLFYLRLKSYKSAYVLKNQVRQLLLKILEDESTRETIFSVLLNHQDSKEYGEKLYFKFGVNGGCEISSEATPVEYEEVADCLLDLVVTDGYLSFNLFTYLLKMLPKLNEIAQNVEKGKLLETIADAMERIEKQITTVKLLKLLSNSTSIQEAQIKNPEPLLDLIKFFFSKIISSSSRDDIIHEQDTEILYTSLMFVKIIITEGKVTETWKIFQDFVSSIRQNFDFKKVPTHVASIVEEIKSLVNKKGKSYAQNYYDLSADSKKLNEFDKALADLADPLLPVRAHGIIALTKLIEHRHPEAAVKKDFLLCIFQENLSHDDSFIYLAAINGICAMSSMFPDKVIEILVQEFVGLTRQTKDPDVSPETRAKLGEILVKTTRSLGEMTPKYKSLLVNGFLCGTRDPDPTVRASSLSCLGEFCKTMGFRLGNLIIEILYCIGCIIKTDKDDGCRRAGVLVATLLLRGLGKDTLTELGENLVTLYRSLKHLRDNDKDPVLQLHAQLALEEFDDIVQQFLFAKPKLEKSIFLLPNY